MLPTGRAEKQSKFLWRDALMMRKTLANMELESGVEQAAEATYFSIWTVMLQLIVKNGCRSHLQFTQNIVVSNKILQVKWRDEESRELFKDSSENSESNGRVKKCLYEVPASWICSSASYTNKVSSETYGNSWKHKKKTKDPSRTFPEKFCEMIIWLFYASSSVRKPAYGVDYKKKYVAGTEEKRLNALFWEPYCFEMANSKRNALKKAWPLTKERALLETADGFLIERDINERC